MKTKTYWNEEYVECGHRACCWAEVDTALASDKPVIWVGLNIEHELVVCVLKLLDSVWLIDCCVAPNSSTGNTDLDLDRITDNEYLWIV